MKFELNTKYTLSAQPGAISPTGITEILRFLNRQNLYTDPLWRAVYEGRFRYLPPLADSWEWVWVLQNGDFRGTFPKRVSQFYHKNFGIKCHAAFLQELGNIARRHSESGFAYMFDFTNEIDWYPGDFGDSGSCYWGGRDQARQMIEDNGGLAIRFYEGDRGYGRAWLAPISPDLHVIWNGYGFQGDSTLIIARIFAQFMSTKYHKIILRNNDHDSGTLWINGGIGYMVGDKAATFSRYDLEWDEPYADSCHSCGDGLTEDEVHYGGDDRPYCQDCFYERWDNCSNCGETVNRDTIYYVEYDYLCEHCYSHLNAACCEHCGEDFYRRHMHAVKSVHWEESNNWMVFYCERCYERYAPRDTTE